MTTEMLRAELRMEAAAARQLRWAVSLAAFGLGLAYGAIAWGLERRDPIYLLLAVGAVAAAASHLVFTERFRVPDCLLRLAAKKRAEPGLYTAVANLWPQLRASHGRRLAALSRNRRSARGVERLSLEEAVALVARTGRRNWDRIARRWSWGLGVVLGFIVIACFLHVPGGV